MTTSEAYRIHIAVLEALAGTGDEIAAKSLACITLVESGWRCGDPDPEDGPDDDGGAEIIPFRRSA
jgi:hypothetical protein